jgi:hypothetical protein
MNTSTKGAITSYLHTMNTTSTKGTITSYLHTMNTTSTKGAITSYLHTMNKGKKTIAYVENPGLFLNNDLSPGL